jgi:outer membrane protein assembly factor BamD
MLFYGRFLHMRGSLAAIVALLLGWSLASCGVLKADNDETKGWSAAKLYAEAKQSLSDRNYEQAIKYYQKLEARYPYGRFAQQAQIEIAYAHFKEGEPALAVAAADRFIKLHPNHPNVDYVYYLKGLANFNEDLGVMGLVGGQDMTERDPKAAAESFEAFKELVNRYPDSKYTPDAVLRMKYLVNSLAAHEVHVARYYYRRGAHVAAVNRVQYALKTYPQAPANEEGLVILVKAYDALGMTDLRDDAERVLKTNFPTTKYMRELGDRSDVRWWQIWNW